MNPKTSMPQNLEGLADSPAQKSEQKQKQMPAALTAKRAAGQRKPTPLNIHDMTAPARIWNTSNTEIQPLEVRAVSGVSSGWCPNSNRQTATLRIAEQ